MHPACFQRLKLKCDKLLSNVAFNCNLRHYSPAELKTHCFCAPHEDVGYEDRNQVINDMLGNYTNVKLIPFKHLTAPRFAMHMKNRKLLDDGCDCTHWWGGAG